MDREELLRPTLSEPGRATGIYSAQATFFTAFFGGPVAAVLIASLNSRRLTRLEKDAVFYAGGLLAFVGLTYVYFADPVLLQAAGLAAGAETDHRVFRYLARGLALLIWLGHYVMIRPEYNAMKLLGTEPPSPWAPALGAIALGIASSAALVGALR